jgi:hypothetical protein
MQDKYLCKDGQVPSPVRVEETVPLPPGATSPASGDSENMRGHARFLPPGGVREGTQLLPADEHHGCHKPLAPHSAVPPLPGGTNA